MARKAPPSRTSKEAPVMSVDQIQRCKDRLNERIAELQSFNVNTVPEGNSPELSALSAAILDALSRSFGEGTAKYQRFSSAATLQFRPIAFSGNYPQRHHYQEGAGKKIADSVALLLEAKRVLDEDLLELQDLSDESGTPKRPAQKSRKVFVVHGHDDAALYGLARFLERLDLEAVILREQADQGQTIIEKFESLAKEVGYAVILLTPDDIGSASGSSQPQARARQNVLFELGFFAGKLGRGCVCLLRKGAVEIPSDLYGVVYTDLDSADGWKLRLGRELKAVGYSVDLNNCI